MSLTIKLVRHGESLANVGQVRSWEVGDHAIPLTELGHAQARGAGRSIGCEFIQRALLYSSPFLRARETLSGILKGASVPRDEVRVYEDPRLREVEHGYADVPSQRELRDVHGAFYYRYHGGESPADCYDRTSGFLEGLMRQVERKRAERVLMVTHGLTIRCFVMRFLHLTVEQFETMANPGNGDVITIAAREEVEAPSFATSRWAVTGLRTNEKLGGVSRESARTIAEREIGAVRAVCSVEELTSRAPVLYGGPDLARCWIAYAVSDGRVVKSSDIVLVDKQNGAVLYAGPANDEG